MLLDNCRKCLYFVTTVNNCAVCSYNSKMTEREIVSEDNLKKVSSCPLEKSEEYEQNAAFGKSFKCRCCDGSGFLEESGEKVECPLCQGYGTLGFRDEEFKEEEIPHIAEFRIQAIQIKDKYKVVMTTEKNNKLISMSKLVDLESPLYNELFAHMKKELDSNK